MNTDTGHIYRDPGSIRAAQDRGEPLVMITAAEAAILAAERESDRMARLQELRSRPGMSRGAKKRLAKARGRRPEEH
ncbi:MAG: hypothetical protein M0Z95_04410 [Actinomycetota bacterium]|nr:hypothetical protein [Actinomycetota bacterium]